MTEVKKKKMSQRVSKYYVNVRTARNKQGNFTVTLVITIIIVAYIQTLSTRMWQ